MLKCTIKKAFDKIVEDRALKVAYEKAVTDEDYIEAEKKRSTLLRMLDDSLTTDKQKRLLDELEGAWYFAEGILQEYVYRQGLEDSPEIHNELRLYGFFANKGE